MIFIDRSTAVAPTELTTAGAQELANVIRPKATSTPPTLTSEDFRRSVYGSGAVKKVLWEMQHGKCCFCEKEVEIKFSTVEHFRPKTRAVDDAGSKRMGYWWLGYVFENLYLCCSNCNHPKSDYFPLAAGSAPLAPEAMPSAANPKEQCVLLDPGVDDPEPHIRWVFVKGKGAVPVGNGERGEKTINATHLDRRDELTELRGRYYKKHVVPVISRYKRAARDGNATGLAEAQAEARGLTEPDSQYAAMARAMLRQAGIL